MSEFHFCTYYGHLSQRLIKAVEREFPEVSVINYSEPGGEKRGWFSGPNRGFPFDNNLSSRVIEWVRTSSAASKADRVVLDLHYTT